MKKVIVFLFLLIPILSSAQISKSGYKQYKWGQLHTKTSTIINCNAKLAGAGFINCDVINKDSLFINNCKYIFCNARFYKDKLSELQFDINHSDLATIIAFITKKYGSPIVKEKRHQALDKENRSIGYLWNFGDTQVFIINDGNKVPAICILSSISIKKTYPENTLSLEKLIFE